jgi:hypothetical protein
MKRSSANSGWGGKLPRVAFLLSAALAALNTALAQPDHRFDSLPCNSHLQSGMQTPNECALRKRKMTVLCLTKLFLFTDASLSLTAPWELWSQTDLPLTSTSAVVEVPCGRNILMDLTGDIAFGGLVINGHLKFQDVAADVHITTDHVLVHGFLTIGEQGAPLSNKVRAMTEYAGCGGHVLILCAWVY